MSLAAAVTRSLSVPGSALVECVEVECGECGGQTTINITTGISSLKSFIEQPLLQASTTSAGFEERDITRIEILGFSERSQPWTSDVLTTGGVRWKLVVFPRGTNDPAFIGAFIEIVDTARLPCGWSFDGMFSIEVAASVRLEEAPRRSGSHTFNEREKSWGFAHFTEISRVFDRSRGLLENDVMKIVVKFRKLNPWLEDGERADPAIYITVRAVLVEHLCAHRNKVDLIEAFNQIPAFKLRKSTTSKELIPIISERTKIPFDTIRLWLWAVRQNKTVRPWTVVAPTDVPIDQLRRIPVKILLPDPRQ